MKCPFFFSFKFQNIKDGEIQLFVKCKKKSYIFYIYIYFSSSQMYEKKIFVVKQYLLVIVKWKLGCDFGQRKCI